jgi:hypothetical protein
MKIEDLHDVPEMSQEELGRLLDGVNLRVVFASRKAVKNSQAFA